MVFCLPHLEASLRNVIGLVSGFSIIYFFSFSLCSPQRLQCRRIFGAGALNNPSLLSSWARKRERAGASQKLHLRERTTG